MGGALAYLFLFNRTTRQSLHDLATGTFVVEAGHGSLEPAAGKMPRFHAAVAAGWILLVVGWIGARDLGLVGSLVDPAVAANLETVERSVDALPRVVRSEVARGNVAPATGRPTWYSVAVFVDEPPADFEAMARRIVATARAAGFACAPDDRFAVVVTRGFSLGISSFWWTFRRQKTCAEWDAEAAGAAGATDGVAPAVPAAPATAPSPAAPAPG